MRKHALCTLALALVMAPVMGMAQAKLPVAYDSGKGIPMGPYVSYLIAGDDVAEVSPLVHFPLRSRMRPGQFAGSIRIPAITPQWMTHPVALVGTDDASRAWLTRNGTALDTARGFVLVVSAGTAADFKALQREFPTLALAPALSPWLQDALIQAGAASYPVLVDTAGFARQGMGETR